MVDLDNLFNNPLRVHVTRKDVLRGERCEHQHCPVALATNRYLPEGYRSFVAVDEILILDWNNKPVAKAPTPECAKRFIRAFDQGGITQVEELTFTLQLVAP